MPNTRGCVLIIIPESRNFCVASIHKWHACAVVWKWILLIWQGLKHSITISQNG